MKTEEIRWNEVQSFIMTMDSTVPKEIHVLNAVRDNWMYGWNANTLMALLKAINETYERLGEL